jgi:hypothetical protein
MQTTRSFWRKLLKVEPDISAYQWFIDRIRENWIFIVGTAGSGGFMTYLAAITKWLEPWGPIGWGVIGLGSIIITNLGIAIAFYIYAVAKQRSVQLRYIESKIGSSSANILAPIHHNERINLVDFFHPFYKPTKQVRFENCDLMGPSNILIAGCMFDGCNFVDCETVIVLPDSQLRGVTFFEGCHFVNSRLYRCTLFMPMETYRTFPDLMKVGLPIISDGNAGEA